MNDVMGIDQAGPGLKDFTGEKRGDSDVAGLSRSAARVRPGSIVEPLSVLLVLAGSGMQGYANGTVDAFFVAILLLLAGVTAVIPVFLKGRAELRAFLLTYGVCVFVGGLAQCYSLVFFHNPQSTIDAVYTFFPLISFQPPFTTAADIPPFFNSPLAILIWQQVYRLSWMLGFDFGPYVGVMFNAFVMGLIGSITVRIARDLFGNDVWRLRRVGTLFAFCGIFILFGSVLLRDCFTAFFNTLVLWGLVHWLCRSTLIRFIIAVALTGISISAMAYLRFDSIVLFGLFWLMALMFWFLKRRPNGVRIFAVGMLLLALLFAGVYIKSYIDVSLVFQSTRAERYLSKHEEYSKSNSLVIRYVLNQPFLIRSVLGTPLMWIHPIPLWHFFRIELRDYEWLLGYHGIYQIIVLPLLFVGIFKVLHQYQKERCQSLPFLFLVLYIIVSFLVVVMTSLEMRHVGQFFPAFIIIAALPDTRETKTQNQVRWISIWWFSFVYLVHIAYLIRNL